ncbi:hypothetical protein EWM64_g833 [Hericium alpestre]|uniref:CRAL-TRIO domain-containing protein n=1 Tax=Hericium alpestre TaxID=135208 RepID=A0A4Z0AA40_9AGAM|nr:hypothetical protein EWM64_g833 [Hericium alpestre]
MSTANAKQHYDLLAGHLGHLTEDQQKKFTTFKDNLAKAKLCTVEIPPDVRASHDDATILRFLRARRFDPDKAQKQFATTEEWRRKQDIDRLYATFDAEEFEHAKHFYPRWTGRRDKHGVPVYVFRLASLDSPMQKELNAIPVERRYQRIVALWEFMSRFTLPLCGALPHHCPNDTDEAPSPPNPTPISTVTSIIDLENVSLETLHRIAVVNAPGFFPTVWNWIKVWFDEGTRNKVFVLGNDPGPQLRTFIAPQDLPRTYGGELDFNFGDEPVLDDAARAVLGEQGVPKGPIVFANGYVTNSRVPGQDNENADMISNHTQGSASTR